MIKKAKETPVPLSLFFHAERMSWDRNCVFLRAHVEVKRSERERTQFSTESMPTRLGRIRTRDLSFLLILNRGEQGARRGPGEFEYHAVQTVNAYDARRMAQTLDSIGRAMGKLAERFGSCESFRAWYRRACDVLGVSEVAFSRQAMTLFRDKESEQADDNGVVTTSVETGEYWISHIIEACSAPEDGVKNSKEAS